LNGSIVFTTPSARWKVCIIVVPSKSSSWRRSLVRFPVGQGRAGPLSCLGRDGAPFHCCLLWRSLSSFSTQIPQRIKLSRLFGNTVNQVWFTAIDSACRLAIDCRLSAGGWRLGCDPSRAESVSESSRGAEAPISAPQRGARRRPAPRRGSVKAGHVGQDRPGGLAAGGDGMELDSGF
jgi:hypothetical protein